MAKSKLLFMMDEGVGDSEILSIYRNDFCALDKCLTNIYNGLKPLCEKFDVILQIYPYYHYKIEGFKNGGTEPLDRISDVLKHTFEFFKKTEMNICLEMYSSGGYTNQNGELGQLPLVPVHYGDKKLFKSLPMDMEALSALKKAYPKTLESVRFHELVGTHEIGLHDQGRGCEESSHGFIVKEEVVKGVIDTCLLNNICLVWGDHSFNLVDEQKEKFACFKTWLDYAVDRLKDKGLLILNWANNGWPMHKYITGKFAFANYRGTPTGMSVQSWFWQETDSSTMTYFNGEKWDIKWHPYAEFQCPVELMAMYTLYYLEKGCCLIQYEPSFYFFNYYRPGKGKANKYRGNVENLPDYSLRLLGKRFIKMLLDGVEFSINPADYFDKDKDRFVNNFENSGAVRYYQNTLGVAYKENNRYFDIYNNDYNKIIEDSNYRYLERFFFEAKKCVRFHNGYSGIDDLISLRQDNCLTFFNMRNGLVKSDALTLSNYENLVSICSLNVVNKYDSTYSGDSDELIAFYSHNGEIKNALFVQKGNGNDLVPNFELVESDNSILKDFIPEKIDEKDLLDILPVRTRMSVLEDSTRPLDAGIIAVHKKDNSIIVNGKINGKEIKFKLELSGEPICATTIDINGDIMDELAVCINRNGAIEIIFVSLIDGKLLKNIIALTEKPLYLFSQRIGFNQKAFKPTFKNLDNALLL